MLLIRAALPSTTEPWAQSLPSMCFGLSTSACMPLQCITERVYEASSLLRIAETPPECRHADYCFIALHLLLSLQLVTEAGGTYLEAPVSGSKGPAEQGTLIFLCGGERELYDKSAPLLDVMGKAKLFLGEVEP